MTIPNGYFDDIRGPRTGLQERDTSRMSLRGDTRLDRRYFSGLVDCACVATREKLQSLHWLCVASNLCADMASLSFSARGS